MTTHSSYLNRMVSRQMTKTNNPYYSIPTNSSYLMSSLYWGSNDSATNCATASYARSSYYDFHYCNSWLEQ